MHQRLYHEMHKQMNQTLRKSMILYGNGNTKISSEEASVAKEIALIIVGS